jgi:hypothetical protein
MLLSMDVPVFHVNSVSHSQVFHVYARLGVPVTKVLLFMCGRDCIYS